MNNTQNLLNFKLKEKFLKFSSKILNNPLKSMWKVEAKFCFDIMYWIIFSWSTKLSEIWKSLKEKKKLFYTEKRLSRNLQKIKKEWI
jgi:hypothetical protein